MTTLARRTNPINDLLSWLENDTGLGLRSAELRGSIKIEDFVEDGTYVLRAEMPGIDPDTDVAISIDNGMLTIRGERRDEQHDRGHHEFHYGAFSRTVALPNTADAEGVKATYVDGVLDVRVPMDVSEPAPTRIPVQRPEAERSGELT